MDSCNPKNITGFNFTNACEYVKNNPKCDFDSGFIAYFKWQYCAFDNRGVPTFLMFLWFSVLLLTVAVTADSFFSACLVVVTRILRMSQNLAGVTLLALGNGAADVFSSLSAVMSSNKPNVNLALGSILGAGILVNTVAAGIIMCVIPFTVMRRPVMKDLIFYFFALLWTMVILIRKQIELWSSLSLLGIYIIYVLVTAISRAIYVRQKKSKIQINIQYAEENNKDENPCNSKKSYSNPTYVYDENSPVTLNVPQSDLMHGSEGSVTHRSGIISTEIQQLMNTSILLRMQHLKSISMRSTSHRTLGSFAKAIIENEFQKELYEINSKIEDIKIPSRTVSLSHFEESSTTCDLRKHRSMNEGPGNTGNKIIPKLSPSTDNLNALSDIRIVVPHERNINMSSGRYQENFQDICLNSISTSKRLTEEDIQYPGIFKHFILTIFPIQLEDWKEKSVYSKILEIIQCPILFVLTMTIPVVQEDAYLRGWCKILNCIHCITSPLIWILFIRMDNTKFGDSNFTLLYFVLITGGICAILVALTSKADTPPVYYNVFAFVGFLTSIVWIYETANEIVNILETFGVVLSIPQTVLGLSVLAFANSIGDLVSNIMLARKNFPKIAYTACIGGPLFNLLVGIGLPFSIVTAKQGTILIELQPETIVLIFTIMFITMLNIFMLPILRFKLRRFYGIILLGIYLLFFVLVMLFAAKVIKLTV